jgi:predicted nucleic acid-binding protein
MILLDTGPLVALCDRRDSRHRTAVTHLAHLVSESLGVCEAVLVEASFHLPRPIERSRLGALLTELRVDSLPTHATDFRADVLAWLLKYADQDPDWADGCIAVLCGRNARLKVWTFDREFRTTWRKPDGKAIPLAVPSRAAPR